MRKRSKLGNKLKKSLESITDLYYKSALIISPAMVGLGSYFYFFGNNKDFGTDILIYNFLYSSVALFLSLKKSLRTNYELKNKRDDIEKLVHRVERLQDIQSSSLKANAESLVAQSKLINTFISYEWKILDNPYELLLIDPNEQDKFKIALAYVTRFSDIFSSKSIHDEDPREIFNDFLLMTNAYLQLANWKELKRRINKSKPIKKTKNN